MDSNNGKSLLDAARAHVVQRRSNGKVSQEVEDLFLAYLAGNVTQAQVIHALALGDGVSSGSRFYSKFHTTVLQMVREGRMSF